MSTTTAYLLGLATLPFLVAVVFVLLVATALIVRPLVRRGFFVATHGIGDDDTTWCSTRTLRGRFGVYVGTFDVDLGIQPYDHTASHARFIAIGRRNGKHGLTIGRTCSWEQPGTLTTVGTTP